MTRRGIFATLALGLICAIASAPVPPALAFSPAAPPPVVHSADALRDLWAVRYETDSPELMRNDLIRRYGPLPWHFERGDRKGSGVAEVVIFDVQNELLPVHYGPAFLGFQAYGEVKGPSGFRQDPPSPGMTIGYTNDVAADRLIQINRFPRINTVAFDRVVRMREPYEVGAVITLPA